MSSAVTSAPGGQPATTSEDSARHLRLRVLNDIADSKVYRFPIGVFTVDSRTVVADDERAAYIEELRRLWKASWVMECNGMFRHDKDHTAARLRLTTLGEVGLDGLEHDRAVTR